MAREFTMDDATFGHWNALKVSAMSIAQQQRILRTMARNAAKKAQGQNSASTGYADSYTWHRKVKLAREARMTHLIRAYLKGTPYDKVEHKLNPHTLPVLILMFDYLNISLSEVIGDVEKFMLWVGYDTAEMANYSL